MKVIERFLHSTDANLVAAFLQNQGIDATVFEDSAFGGDGLGGTKSTARVVVPDEQFDQATAAFQEYQKGEDVEG